MTREERIKQEAEKYRKYRESYGVIDPVVLDEIEDAYYDGCLCAENAMIKKACEWLRTHSEADYFELISVGNYCGAGNLNKKKMIEDFKKYMEE